VVADDEILRRLDEFLADNRTELAALTGVVAENTAVIAENKAVVAENTAVIAKNQQAMQDVGVALRQMTLRADRVALDHRRALQELVAEIRDGRDEMRAQRQALFAMIDLLRGGGGGPAPAGA